MFGNQPKMADALDTKINPDFFGEKLTAHLHAISIAITCLIGAALGIVILSLTPVIKTTEGQNRTNVGAAILCWMALILMVVPVPDLITRCEDAEVDAMMIVYGCSIALTFIGAISATAIAIGMGGQRMAYLATASLTLALGCSIYGTVSIDRVNSHPSCSSAVASAVPMGNFGAVPPAGSEKDQ